MSGAELALEGALVALVTEDAGVRAIMGDPVRVAGKRSETPAYPYFEIARHSTEPANAAGAEQNVHRVDLVIVSRNDGGEAGVAGIGAIRSALETADLPMQAWRCVLLTPVFADQLRQGGGVWRCLLRLRIVVEAVTSG